MSVFGERLRLLREERRMTQKELSKKFKLALSTISMYERGEREPSFEIVAQFADFFNVSVDYLLGKVDYRSHSEYATALRNYADEIEKTKLNTDLLSVLSVNELIMVEIAKKFPDVDLSKPGVKEKLIKLISLVLEDHDNKQ